MKGRQKRDKIRKGGEYLETRVEIRMKFATKTKRNFVSSSLGAKVLLSCCL
jgi:hypothetical protein